MIIRLDRWPPSSISFKSFTSKRKSRHNPTCSMQCRGPGSDRVGELSAGSASVGAFHQAAEQGRVCFRHFVSLISPGSHHIPLLDSSSLSSCLLSFFFAQVTCRLSYSIAIRPFRYHNYSLSSCPPPEAPTSLTCLTGTIKPHSVKNCWAPS